MFTKTINIIFLAFFLFSCSPKYIKITSNNNLIELPSYSFLAPDSEGWYLTMLNQDFEVADVNHYYQNYGCGISLKYENLNDKYSSSEEVFADLKKEIINPIIKIFPNVIVDHKDNIITMNHDIYYNICSFIISHKSDKKTREAALFVHFPNDNNPNQFIAVMYDEYYLTNKERKYEYFDIFKSLLNTIKLKL